MKCFEKRETAAGAGGALFTLMPYINPNSKSGFFRSDSIPLIILKRRSDYKRGQPLRLLSCDTGSSTIGFAQNLANKLNVVVEAPTKLVWAYPNGKYFVAGRRKDNPNLPDMNNPGVFKKFYPGGKKK